MPSSSGRAAENGRGSSSSINSRRQQRLEAALSDVESSFDRISHSSRYASHVLDVQSNNEDTDEESSIGSRLITGTTQWFLSDLQQEPDDDNDSHSSDGMMDLWQKQSSIGVVDQSVNLMDATTAQYEEQEEQYSSLDSLKIGLESFCKPDTTSKTAPFVFPTLNFAITAEKESTIRKSRLRISKDGKEKRGSKRKTTLTLLAVCFLVGLISIAVLALLASLNSRNSLEFDGEGIVTAVKTAEHQETSTIKSIESREGESTPKDQSFAIFEAAANASTMEALAEEKNDSTSHSYVVTHEDVIFRPTAVLPAKTKARALMAILLEFKVSDPDDILQPKQQSAAFRAMQWMAEEDPAELYIPSTYYQSAHMAKMSRHGEEWRDDTFLIQQILQRYVLAVFYFSLQPSSDKAQELTKDDVVGDENHQRFQKSWLSQDHVCHWRGVDCGSYLEGRAGVDTAHLSNVVSLNLTRHNLVGTLPPQWLSGTPLPDLTMIDLSHNNLYGTLPLARAAASNKDPFTIHTAQGEYHLQLPRNNSWGSSFSTDSELLHFDVSFNQLRGALPPLLQQLKHCQNLFLDHNHFSGHLETLVEDGVGEGNLEQLDIGNNLLTGSIPASLSSLEKLQLLSMESNFLSGSIPEVFEELTDMVELHVNDNILEGRLPKTLGQLSKIERLFLDHNELSGTMPSSWESMSTLEKLSVHHNVLTGGIPSYIGSGMQHLLDLRIQNNRLGGSIPSELGLCTSLRQLYLEENFFRGSPPSSLGSLKQLEELRLFGNRLTGTMPSTVCDLLHQSHLKTLATDCKGDRFECSCCNACF